MKQKILFFGFYFLIVAIKAQETIPQPTYSEPVEFAIPSGYPHRSEVSVIRGTIYVYTHDNSRNISDPIIVPEGFDALNENSWAYGYSRLNQSNTLECLHGLGYDFVWIDFEDGGNYLELNAYLVAQIIMKINAEKITNHQNIVWGSSMGGLIARYALTYMEHENMDHNTRLFISYDSPHLGANAPLGIQLFAKYAKEGKPGPYRMLSSRAARQMLIHHIDITQTEGHSTPDPLRQTFIDNLAGIGSWPKKLRKVGITNGSGYGLKQLKDDGITPLEPGDTTAELHVLEAHSWALAAPLPGVTSEVGRIRILFEPAQSITVVGTLPYDNMPGGFQYFGYQIPLNEAHANAQCFIPLFSSLAIPNNDNYYNVYADPTALSRTPFDAIYYSVSNSEHVSISEEKKNWLLNEMYPYKRLHIYTPSIQPPRGSVDLESYGEITLFPGVDLTGSIGASARIKTTSPPYCGQGPLAKGDTNPTVSSGVNTIQVIHSQTSNNGSQTLLNSMTADAQPDSEGLTVYPNPSGGLITLSHASALQLVEVYNLAGVLVCKRQVLNDIKTNLDLSEFPKGMYLLKVNTVNGQIHYKKVTIE